MSLNKKKTSVFTGMTTRDLVMQLLEVLEQIKSLCHGILMLNLRQGILVLRKDQEAFTWSNDDVSVRYDVGGKNEQNVVISLLEEGKIICQLLVREDRK